MYKKKKGIQTFLDNEVTSELGAIYSFKIMRFIETCDAGALLHEFILTFGFLGLISLVLQYDL